MTLFALNYFMKNVMRTTPKVFKMSVRKVKIQVKYMTKHSNTIKFSLPFP